MQWFYLAVVVLFAAIIVIFAAQNFQSVMVSFLGLSAEAPLALVIVLIYLLGATTGGSLLAMVNRSIKGAGLRSTGN